MRGRARRAVATRRLALAGALALILWALTPASTSDVESTSSRRARARVDDRPRARERDVATCAVAAPSRMASRVARERLYGGGTSRGALRALRGDGVTPRKGAGAYGDALDRYGFFLFREPALSERLADATRSHLLDLLRRSERYDSEDGCLGHLANCQERFDFSLRLTNTVTRALNEIVSRLRPALVDIFGDDECELVELSALITCKGSPLQRLHSDAGGLKGDDRLVSVFVSLQDTPVELGPTHVFFNSPNALTELDFYSAAALMRHVALELGNSSDAVRAHGLADIYIDEHGFVSVPSEEEEMTEQELAFFDAHVRVDERDNTLAFHPPWDATARMVLGVVGAGRQGSALVYDSRTSHRGGKNTLGARVQFMFSFQSKGAYVPGSTYTMRRRYQRIERIPLTLTDRATMRSLGRSFRKDPSAGAWDLRVTGKYRLRDFPLRADTSDEERDWVDDDVATNMGNNADFDIDGLGLDGKTL